MSIIYLWLTLSRDNLLENPETSLLVFCKRGPTLLQTECYDRQTSIKPSVTIDEPVLNQV